MTNNVHMKKCKQDKILILFEVIHLPDTWITVLGSSTVAQIMNNNETEKRMNTSLCRIILTVFIYLVLNL